MNLSRFEWADRAKNLFTVIAIAGFVILFVGYLKDPGRAYHAYLMSLYYFLCITIGGIFFAATQHVTNAGWSASVRRIGEAFFSFFPYVLFGLIILYLVQHNIYEWTHADKVAQDPLLTAKKGYLNPQFFGIRLVVIMGLWAFFGYSLLGNSLKQDQDGQVAHTQSNSKLSAAFLPLFALSFSFVSFDLIMSLQPHFFSTMFAVYCFAGLFMATLSMMTLFIIYLYEKGFLRGFVNENHFHDMGKLMFAMVIFWAYVGFSQFMLIWYANLPEETFYYADRAVGGWKAVSYALLVFKFILPFLLLLPREAKRNPVYLKRMAYWLLAAQLLDIYWMVMPTYLHQNPQFPWIELGAFMGFLGAFVLVVMRFLSKNAIVAQKDPRLHEALHLHQ